MISLSTISGCISFVFSSPSSPSCASQTEYTLENRRTSKPLSSSLSSTIRILLFVSSDSLAGFSSSITSVSALSPYMVNSEMHDESISGVATFCESAMWLSPKGNSTTKVVPFPSMLRTLILPLWASIILLASANPMPVPFWLSVLSTW